MIKRGDIFYADLNPIVGSEQGGIRPVLIIQNDIVILTEQIRTLDRRRLCAYVGSLDCSIMKKVDEALKISMGV